MRNRRTALDSAELSVFVTDSLAAAGPGARPRFEIAFDVRTRIIDNCTLSLGGGHRGPIPAGRLLPSTPAVI